MKAVRSKKLKNVCNLTFIHRGYANWKDASGKTGAFCKHESSSFHKQAVEVIYTLPRTTLDVGKLPSAAHVSEKESNRKYLLLKCSLHNGLLTKLALWKRKPAWLVGLFTNIWQRRCTSDWTSYRTASCNCRRSRRRHIRAT